MEMQWDSSTFKPGLLLASVLEGTTWKCSGIAVHLNLDCCLLQLWRALRGNVNEVAVELRANSDSYSREQRAENISIVVLEI